MTLVVSPYQAIRRILLGKPRVPAFLEGHEGPRHFGSKPNKPPRRTRYLLYVPSVSAWSEPRRLTIHCTGEIAEPEIWVDEKPSTPSQCLAESTFFRVDFAPDKDKLRDGVQIFILYYHWEPGVRIYSIEP